MLAIKSHGKRYPDFPLPLSGGVVRIACPEKEEYVSSAAFSDAVNIIDVWKQPFGVGLAIQALTMRPGTFWEPRASANIVGRWWSNDGILTGFLHGDAWVTPTSANKPEQEDISDWEDIGNKYDDISKLVLRYLDEAIYYFRRGRPNTFRQMIYAHRTPDTEDFTWLTVDDLWALREQCKRMKTGTWTRMRRWLMRQQLTDRLRRVLGGRPGRLLENQRRTKDNREFRRIRTDRRKGGDSAAT